MFGEDAKIRYAVLRLLAETQDNYNLATSSSGRRPEPEGERFLQLAIRFVNETKEHLSRKQLDDAWHAAKQAFFYSSVALTIRFSGTDVSNWR